MDLYDNDKVLETLKNEDVQNLEFFQSNVYNPNMCTEDGLTLLHCMAKKHNESDLLMKYIELCKNMKKKLHIDAKERTGKTPLFIAVLYGNIKMAEVLMKFGANPMITDENMSTPLHALACNLFLTNESVQSIFAVIKQKKMKIDINIKDKMGQSILNLAVTYGHFKMFDEVLKMGADPNLSNDEGSTPLHIVCSQYSNIEMIRRLIDLCQVNDQDKKGNTALHFAVRLYDEHVVRLLLEKNADPSLANEEGLTPLHSVSKSAGDKIGLATMLIDARNQNHSAVQVDAQDNRGNSPLLWALLSGNPKVAELLLTRGADPNLSNDEGSTPLHAISKRNCISYQDNQLVKLFFQTCKDLQKILKLDARDKLGRTPLELAILNVHYELFVELLNRGAHVCEKIDFPTRNFLSTLLIRFPKDKQSNVKLKLLIIILKIIEILQEKEYELEKSEAFNLISSITILLPSYKMSSDKITKFKVGFKKDIKFSNTVKNITINSNLSLYDLIQLQPKEADKVVSYSDFFALIHREDFSQISKQHRENFDYSLCEQLLRKFLMRWALDAFSELIHHRLPIEICDIVMSELHNLDLVNICMATAGQNS